MTTSRVLREVNLYKYSFDDREAKMEKYVLESDPGRSCDCSLLCIPILWYASIRIRSKSNLAFMRSQEVSSAHSTLSLSKGKEQTQSTKLLHPQYVVGFIDGEGSFSVSIYHDKTMKDKEIIELRDKIRLLGKKHKNVTVIGNR